MGSLNANNYGPKPKYREVVPCNCLILQCVIFVMWLCVFISHCKYPFVNILTDIHLYKFFTSLDINKYVQTTGNNNLSMSVHIDME